MFTWSWSSIKSLFLYLRVQFFIRYIFYIVHSLIPSIFSNFTNQFPAAPCIWLRFFQFPSNVLLLLKILFFGSDHHQNIFRTRVTSLGELFKIRKMYFEIITALFFLRSSTRKYYDEARVLLMLTVPLKQLWPSSCG